MILLLGPILLPTVPTVILWTQTSRGRGSGTAPLDSADTQVAGSPLPVLSRRDLKASDRRTLLDPAVLLTQHQQTLGSHSPDLRAFKPMATAHTTLCLHQGRKKSDHFPKGETGAQLGYINAATSPGDPHAHHCLPCPHLSHSRCETPRRYHMQALRECGRI